MNFFSQANVRASGYLLCIAACLCSLSELATIRVLAEEPTSKEAASEQATSDEAPADEAPAIAAPETAREARDRAKLLHEMIHGTLQVVHRDFFDEEDAFAIPSRSLEDVFHELGRRYQVTIRWLIVNTDTLNDDHLPRTEFERAAVKSLASGKAYYEKVQPDLFQYAGAINLKSQCLKCHDKRRLTTDARPAGLLISMPIRARPSTTDSQTRSVNQ